MKNKEFEAIVLVICLATISFIVGLSLVFNENKIENNEEKNFKNVEYRLEE